MSWFLDQHSSGTESPYGTGNPYHVVLARSAKTWTAEIEARLAERELTTDLAPTVIALCDWFGMTVDEAIDMLLPALR